MIRPEMGASSQKFWGHELFSDKSNIKLTIHAKICTLEPF